MTRKEKLVEWKRAGARVNLSVRLPRGGQIQQGPNPQIPVGMSERERGNRKDQCEAEESGGEIS